MIILSILHNWKVEIKNTKILDIGSGSGHWIKFYNKYFPSEILGIDISKTSFDYLNNKFKNQKNINFSHGKAVDILTTIKNRFFIVNAIGVMFHIVDEDELQTTIYKIYNSLTQNGFFIISGHFGLLNNLNIQLDTKGNVNKRLRSFRYWKKILKKNGFQKVVLVKNNAYLKIDWLTPEANIIIAIKKV